MNQILPEQSQEQATPRSNKRIILWNSLGLTTNASKFFFFSLLVAVLFVIVFAYLLLPPASFPSGETLTVEKGASLGKISLYLKEHNAIRSRVAFEFCMTSLGGDKRAAAGDYLFKTPIGACSVAYRITRGISGVPVVRATIPEGISNQGIADILEPILPKFDAKFFVEKARSQEGFLFPETYFFSMSASTDDILKAMNTEFRKRIEPWTPFIDASGHTERDIITMASILEKEAKTEEDMEIVSGILWKRISRGIPLQVDAPFYYLLGKTSSEITQVDLAMKSAYNTYKNKGLPAGPIGNPGIVAIRAALQPKESPYMYYLSDKDNQMHYAKTFEEHKANKAKYLQ